MGLFDKVFNKKEEGTRCNCKGGCAERVEQNNQTATGARFIVLGACCKKSTETFENTKIAVKEMGFSDEVVNIGDMAQIANYGVMSTPALVIEGKVVSYGKLLKVEDVKKIIEKLEIK